jgi:hypothetical protein
MGKARFAGPESHERCLAQYNIPFPVERVRVFCSEFVTAAPNGAWPILSRREGRGS